MASAEESTVDLRIANMDETTALPRQNGELLFEAPWEARAFGLAVTLNEQGAYPWRDFSQKLADHLSTIESNGDTAGETAIYYEQWLATLEEMAIANGLLTQEELDAMIEEQVHHDLHEHDH